METKFVSPDTGSAAVRYTFRGALLLEGALHIGSGRGGRVGEREPSTDATVIRDSLGHPYIPGSSLRGALRSAVAQVAPLLLDQSSGRLLDDEEAIEQMRQEVEREVAQAAARASAADTAFDTEGELQQRLEARLSPFERLFGTTLWASPLYIPDLYLQGEQPEDGEVRHGVGIDRDTGAAREGIKYDFEVLPRWLTFDFFMRCELPARHRERQEQLLAIGLRMLEQGEIRLGGRAARGVGHVRLLDLAVYQLTLNRASLLARLKAGPQAGEGELRPDWVQQQIDALAG